MAAEANADLLMQKYVLDIKHQANLLVLQMKAKIYRVIPMEEVEAAAGDDPSIMIAELQRQLEVKGFAIEEDAESIRCVTENRATAEQRV